MPEYQIGQVEVTEIRTVKMAIGTSSIVKGWGARFEPDRLVITYRNGKLQAVILSGPAMTKEGKPYANLARGMADLTNNPPEWIFAEVNRYQPRGV